MKRAPWPVRRTFRIAITVPQPRLRPNGRRHGVDHSLSNALVYDHGWSDQRFRHANPANTATDFNLTGQLMASIRTANKRHKRALVTRDARKKVAQQAAEVKAKPAKAAS